jgi:hypothetical protein
MDLMVASCFLSEIVVGFYSGVINENDDGFCFLADLVKNGC